MQSEEVGVEDVEDLLYYLEPLVRGLGTGEAGSLAQALQELEAGGSSHRLMARLGTRLRTTMGGQVRLGRSPNCSLPGAGACGEGV